MFLPVTKVREVSQAKVLRATDQEIREQLPPPPEFDYLKSPFPPHDARPRIPGMPKEQDHSPLGLFSLFFTDSILESIVANTNRYAELKRVTGDSWRKCEISVVSCM